MKHDTNSLLRSHIKLAHAYWEQLLTPGDCVVDATCGNGHDTLKLCQLVLTPHSGQVFAYDIQEEAIVATRSLLREHLSDDLFNRVVLIYGCHSQFDIVTSPVKLVVYNLGYLPGGNKAMTTQTATSLKSVYSACQLMAPGGLISITCYPGHPEGEIEEKALLESLSTLPREGWNCVHLRWINRKRSPNILLLEKLQ